VYIGNSGLKVSKLILGCLSYGEAAWQPWILDEEQGLQHIKAAYDAGINTFDTANIYSNGLSEVILGKAIKMWGFPRDEIVVMTKVCLCAFLGMYESNLTRKQTHRFLCLLEIRVRLGCSHGNRNIGERPIDRASVARSVSDNRTWSHIL
jgi:aryl-alcohol dehydrogenase-like predicted oxidoreductase